jgi:hypothetical protein
MAQPTPPVHLLFHVNDQAGQVFLWLSIALAVLTAFFQGLVTSIAVMTESSSRWTFRFRLALFEHWWWTVVSVLLLASLSMNTLAFASGTSGEAVSVLALSSATFLAVVRYMLPAWQQRHYILTRWWAWTGDSRTSIPRDKAGLCGDAEAWKQVVRANKAKLSQLQQTPSDVYGWRLWPVGGIPYDPTDILNVVGDSQIKLIDSEKGATCVGLYHNADATSGQVSLKWGQQQEFRRVISRAVSSMPLGLLQSRPTTVDGYDGQGLAKAMGILGRNKGLQPWKLIFQMDSSISVKMENSSTWTPRPAKVLRSFYKKTLEGQYGGLGSDFVAASVELALLMADMPYWAIDDWLKAGLEHQLLDTNCFLASEVLSTVSPEERSAALAAHYESSYVSMIISLNNMDEHMKEKPNHGIILNRPDIMCLGLLLKARGFKEPSWWNRADVTQMRLDQISSLSKETNWKMPMACLLGLDDWPHGFEKRPSLWNSP